MGNIIHKINFNSISKYLLTNGKLSINHINNNYTFLYNKY